MTQLREKHVGLRTGNKGRFASVSSQEGASLGQTAVIEALTIRYDLDPQTIVEIAEKAERGDSKLQLADEYDLPAPAVADIQDAFTRDQVTADENVPAQMVAALKAAGVSSCHVERMKRGKINVLTNGLSIRTSLNDDGLLEYEVAGETIGSEGPDDHDAWVTALMAAVDHEAVRRNVAPLLAQGQVKLNMNNYTGACKGKWALDGHSVGFEVSPHGNVTFDAGMDVSAAHALQKDLGVTNVKQVSPSIAQLRSRLSTAHRWALWHSSMDTYRHAARPGLKDSYQYMELRTRMEEALSSARAILDEDLNGLVLSTAGPGYRASVELSARRDPLFYVNERLVFGLDETKTKQRELAKFLRSNIDSLRELEIGRSNGLAGRKP